MKKLFFLFLQLNPVVGWINFQKHLQAKPEQLTPEKIRERKTTDTTEE